MKLSINERSMLYNQYEILKGLSDDKYDKERYEYFQTIVYDGFSHEYDELLQGMDNETPNSVAEFVWEVFNLYRTLHNSYHVLSEEEKDQIDEDDVKYQGFDGNEEGEYYNYANFILEKMKRYEEIYNDGRVDLNSHSNKVNQYSCMLTIWKDIRASEHESLDLESIKKIVKWYKYM